jgi:hypothetical protein
MDYSPKKRRNINAEQWILFIGLFGFIVFIWMMAFFFLPLLANRSTPLALSPMIIEIAATRGFILPPTWTPSSTREMVPTATATVIFDGAVPTRIYTPPTSLPGLPLPFRFRN